MTTLEKMKFVQELLMSIELKVEFALIDHKIPDEWDGHELRHYVADLAQANVTKMSHSRKIAYNNIVLVNDL
jgi:hypothetical protein